MNQKEKNSILPSLIDRLIDDYPEKNGDDLTINNQNIDDLKNSVLRDIENLLNTRKRCEIWPTELSELEFSLVNYGVADFLGLNLAFDQGKQILRRMIEEAIRNFEPRLSDVRVKSLDIDEPINRILRFRIRARLQSETIPESIIFDSVFEPVTCNFSLDSSVHE